MRYASVCDGIGAAHVAWKPLGWQCQWTSEIEPFPVAVVEHHYGFRNLGDMTKITEDMIDAPVDLLVGGTPCQSFSVAGLRGGLADPRGNLALRFVQLASVMQPRWIVWENVPGVLTSGAGRDFGTFLGALEQLGYGWAYRTLDSQWFGIAQRRRRVFVIGHIGDWRGAAAVLFERESVFGNPPSQRAEREITAGSVSLGASATVPYTKSKRAQSVNDDETWTLGRVSPTLSCFDSGDTRATTVVVSDASVRRLTPREYERLQGFADDYTLIVYRGAPAADGPRYKALANSMTVPVMRWIGGRIRSASEALAP